MHDLRQPTDPLQVAVPQGMLGYTLGAGSKPEIRSDFLNFVVFHSKLMSYRPIMLYKDLSSYDDDDMMEDYSLVEDATNALKPSVKFNCVSESVPGSKIKLRQKTPAALASHSLTFLFMIMYQPSYLLAGNEECFIFHHRSEDLS